MNWVIEYKDGNVVSSSDCSWGKVPKNKEIISIGIYDNDNAFHCICGDVFFFSDEGSTDICYGKHRWLGRMIAAFDRGSKKGILFRVIPNKQGYEKVKVSLEEFEKKFIPEAFIYNEV